jgi:hypothetical protein
VRLWIAGVRLDAPLGEGDRAGDMRSKFLIDVGRRFNEIDRRTRERSQIVIHGYRTAAEQHVQPEHARERTMRRGIVRRLRDGAPEQVQRGIVVKVIRQLKCSMPQLMGGLRTHRR